ncbi:MAG: HPP family protein [Planctomycetota bacterium]
MIRARDVMSQNVITVTPETPVEELIGLIRASHFTAVPVVDAEGRAIGLVAETDILRALAYILVPPQSGEFAVPPGGFEAASPRDKSATVRLLRAAQRKDLTREVASVMQGLLKRTVHDLMTPVVISCRPDAPLSEVCETLVWKEVHRVVVTDDENRVVGLISSLDLARRFGEELQKIEGRPEDADATGA